MSESKRYLSLDEILAADDLPMEEVSVPEWGEGAVVRVRGLNAEEKVQWVKETVDFVGEEVRPKFSENSLAAFCAKVICDEHGKRLCSAERVAELGQKSPVPLQRIQEVGRRLSGLGQNPEEAAGNSEPTASDSSLSV